MGNLQEKIESLQNEIQFSGTVIVAQGGNEIFNGNYGYANRGDKIRNQLNTKFGIASGCKIFTSTAIGQLVEQGKLKFDSKLKNFISIDFPHFDPDITVHHLLTHTSGVPDYFDEEVMDDFEELWINVPMYHIRSLKDFLPLFQNSKMKYQAGERFSYNNTGYILLGLLVEELSGQSFDEYVMEHIFKRAGMEDSGYFELDRLPSMTATGYIDFEDGSWKTNLYSVPVKGGSDGGAFVTAPDMLKFWKALTSHSLMGRETTEQLLTIHETEKDGLSYGYGIWIEKVGQVLQYMLMGYDPGVNFHASFYPEQDVQIVVCSNGSRGAYKILSLVQEEILSQYR
ncbi:serine hydrolase domain-containing protein [Ureibacillus sinduriensis]|uniref:Penicillin-binding protein n=1 Tax=Ureibacillus sinduriensis BLB-1 = JCM 15800 TaxID=1384057 RepID=A0A0A3HWV3_9BACL|nr:serine hydrolase [Ureibacillus sinduriensis]KGR77096.1 penicillin-binding protein [Ureibacillus sinduriensis BLB-1 = JCM 15800]